MSRRACRALLLGLVMSVGTPVNAAPARATPSLPPLPILPSVARVKIVSHDKTFVIIEEISLPRGDWKGQELRFHVAFGAPGPRAIDAHLVPVDDGALEPDDQEVGETLPVDRVPRKPANAYPLVGRETMAGVVVHIKPDAMTKALGRGNMAALRLRSVVEGAEPDADKASSLVVRLGASRGTPLTLGRIVATCAPPSPPLARVEARLCGPDAGPHPLAVTVIPRVPRSGDPVIAPVLAVRHTSDDLCLRLWPGEAGK